MICPHCRVAFHDKPEEIELGFDTKYKWMIVRRHCPTCKSFIFHLDYGMYTTIQGHRIPAARRDQKLVWPRAANRPPCPQEVSQRFADDYNEACLVLTDSPKASAALSRRCLQNVLREAAKVKPGDLYDEIEEVIQSKGVPTYISETLHAVRTIGNFAAHPIKSKSTGEIVDVEPGEAEWNLEALESVFDFYFVQPARAQQRKDALNKKLQDAGKQPLP